MRRRGAELVLVFGFLGLAAPGAAFAQLGSTFALEDRQAAVARVPVGEIIRLRLSNGGHAGGPVLRWNTFSVTLGPYMGYAERDTFVALQVIDTIWYRGEATRRGALYGGFAGLAVGLVIGATAGSICPTSGGNKPCAQGAVTSAVGGLAIGGLGGALIGSGAPEWRRLHPRGGPRLEDTRAGPKVILEAAGASTEPDRRAMALVRMRPGALVRLRFTDRPDLAGYIVHAGARRAMIASIVEGAEEPISLGSVDGIWERGSAARTGSVLGALLGFGAGLYVAASATTCDPNNDCTASMVSDGLLGGLAGWIGGGRVASTIPRWHRRF